MKIEIGEVYQYTSTNCVVYFKVLSRRKERVCHQNYENGWSVEVLRGEGQYNAGWISLVDRKGIMKNVSHVPKLKRILLLDEDEE